MWTLSDGTKISADGKVTGTSALAIEMRERLDAIELGVPILVQIDAPPGGQRPLDLSNERSIDAWVRECAWRADVTLTESPELLPNTEDPDDESTDEDENQDDEDPVY